MPDQSLRLLSPPLELPADAWAAQEISGLRSACEIAAAPGFGAEAGAQHLLRVRRENSPGARA